MDSAYIKEFEHFLCNEKNASENTRLSYLRDLRQLSEYLNGSLENTSQEALEEYIHKQKALGKSSATLARNIASIKSFYRFLCDKGIMKENPAESLTIEKEKQKLPQILTSSEVEMLLCQPSCHDLKGYRDKAMLEVLYSTGIRVSELIDLNLADIHLDNGTITCRNKNKDRIIPLQPAALKALNEYLCFIRNQMIRDSDSVKVFVNVNGAPMTRQGFWKILKSYQVKAGIEKNITPHTLRHSFAAHLLQKGTDIKSIQQILGHSDVSTTQVYSQLLDIS